MNLEPENETSKINNTLLKAEQEKDPSISPALDFVKEYRKQNLTKGKSFARQVKFFKIIGTTLKSTKRDFLLKPQTAWNK